MNAFNVGQRVSPVSILQKLLHSVRVHWHYNGSRTGNPLMKSETGGTRCPTLLALAIVLIYAGHRAPEAFAGEAVRFQAVDIFVDSKDKPLAAYQLEFSVTNGVAKIVGVEGGEHPAFAEAPFYDLKAMQQERVIIAAFSTQPADKLSVGRTRVATVHLQLSGAAEPEFKLRLEAAAGSDGKQITAEAHVEERKSQ